MKGKISIIVLALLCIISCSKEHVDPSPTATQISPDYGRQGTSISIRGANFGTDLSVVTVIFGNGKQATVKTVTDTLLTVLAPAGSMTGPITITVGKQSVQTTEFTFYSIYTYGATKATTVYNATYWKDDVPTTISTKYSEIIEMIVVDEHTHAIGYEYENLDVNNVSTQKYWRDGVSVPITGINSQTRFSGIAVSGADVYICGTELKHGDHNGVAKCWKNGIETDLDASEYAWTFDIQVFGSDVYVVGYTSPKTVYWKNGVKEELNLHASAGNATAITMVGGDIYIAGNEGDGSEETPGFWKNGSFTRLMNFELDTLNYSKSILVSGSDVYVGGGMTPALNGIVSAGKARYWKNGNMVTIENPGYYEEFAILCMSEFKGNIFMTMSSNEFDASSYVYQNGKEIISSPDFHRKMLGHQIVTY